MRKWELFRQGLSSQSEGFLFGGVGSFASGTELHQFVEGLGVPWDGGIESGVVGGIDVDERPSAGMGVTEDLLGAFLGIGSPGIGAFLVSRALDRAVEEDAVAFGVSGMPPHGQAGWTEGDALVVDLLGGIGGCGKGSVSGVEGDEGSNAFLGISFIDGLIIVGAIHGGG